MKTIKKENKLCLICMEEHEVNTIIQIDNEKFKKEEVSFEAVYEYCNRADELLETEEMIKANSLAMKDAYRKKMDLLTSEEIIEIRKKYKVSQKDFSDILDWGKATIYRYENHQVQDRAHDDILRKINSDPKWFIQMLDRAKDKLTNKAYQKYYKLAKEQFNKKKDDYLARSIQAIYVGFVSEEDTGGIELRLDKVVEVINYFASKVEQLHKVKLAKMLWYADCLSHKITGKPIMGLVYRALPLGAVPEGYDQIIELNDIKYETVSYNNGEGEECYGYKFYPSKRIETKELTDDDIKVLDKVILKVGNLNSKEIISKMHSEDAYIKTERNSIISYSHTKTLSLN